MIYDLQLQFCNMEIDPRLRVPFGRMPGTAVAVVIWQRHQWSIHMNQVKFPCSELFFLVDSWSRTSPVALWTLPESIAATCLTSQCNNSILSMSILLLAPVALYYSVIHIIAWYTLIPSRSGTGYATGAGFAMSASGWCWICDLLESKRREAPSRWFPARFDRKKDRSFIVGVFKRCLEMVIARLPTPGCGQCGGYTWLNTSCGNFV